MYKSDGNDRGDPFGDVLKVGNKDVGCQGMDVVDMGDTTGDERVWYEDTGGWTGQDKRYAATAI